VLSEEELKTAEKKLRCASVLQFTLPGVPSVYYGDEAGVQGGRDPFCRLPFPWGRENKEITEHYKMLCKIRREEKALCAGEIESIDACGGVFCFSRCCDGEKITVCVNMGDKEHFFDAHENCSLIYGGKIDEDGKKITVLPCSFAIVKN